MSFDKDIPEINENDILCPKCHAVVDSGDKILLSVIGQSKCTTCGHLKMYHPFHINLPNFYFLSNAVSV